jgi:AcrR family transcriptional regulator
MQLRARKTKEKILLTAMRLFAKTGFQGTKIDDLASAAKVNRQRIYAYFGSKEKLFQAAMLEVFAKANAEDDKLLKLGEKDLPQLTEILLRHYLAVHQGHPALHRMVGWANLQLKKTPLWMKDIKEKSFAHLRKLYQLGQSQGVFLATVDFDVYIFTLLAATYFQAANRITATQTITEELFSSQGSEKLIRQISDMINCRQNGNVCT